MKNLIKIFIGLAIIASAIVGYRNSLDYLYELTFLSNLACGLVLAADGVIYYIYKKNIPSIVYQMVVLCTNVVFFTCIFTLFGWHSFNFSGAFIFLHAINPVLFLGSYLLLTELHIKDKTDYIKRIFISPALIMGYLIFDYLRYLATGELVYGLVNTQSLTPIPAALIGVGFYLLMAFMSYGLTQLKIYIQRNYLQKGA